ncbi:platelet-activating factor receptor-like [Hemiscyllium ocellatum]|uniref:platelet-activating factor receptor-like n=1 Tax=Hemiscyllium ocellatum TaxID=170820 RepID=UPI002966FA8B|nr:platelet-activating factor receptor-like [Hemiscyllium ocellatum]XP_060703480.1 platelet-activating factor receptor-like [Hemiscyllium ocellatum]
MESPLWNVTEEPTRLAGIVMNSSENSSLIGRVACVTWDPTRNIILPLVYLVVLFVGLFGNCIALLTFLQNARKVKKAIRVYLINLTLADILFNLTLPFWVVYYFKGGDWIFSEVMCRLAGTFYYIATYSAITFMIFISINRYCTVRMKRLNLPFNKPVGSLCTCAAIWVVWIACAIPTLIQQQSFKRGTIVKCFEEYSGKRFYVYASFTFFLISLLIVLLSYISIMKALSAQGKTSQGIHRRLAKSMVLGMLVVFLVCALPYHVFLIPWELSRANSEEISHCGPPKAIDIIHQLNVALLSMNSCIDPIIYCFSVKRFQRELMRTFRKLMRCLPFQVYTFEASEIHIRSTSLTTS